jgi:Icc protein
MITPRTTLPLPKPADKTGIVSWVHFGDLHMTTREQQNYRDLLALVDEVNLVMAASLCFVYLPGDNADHGEAAEYEVVREALDRLELPWFAIVGDHDVHLQSLENFRRFMMPDPVYSFEVGPYCFIALNAFASARPNEFDLSGEQLDWLERKLMDAEHNQRRCVLLLHCYPSDLARTGVALHALIRQYNVLLLDMGHTHYNEIAHDGHALYTATRSTGQIEEGSVGLSVTNLDRGVVSWRFKPLGAWPLVMITTPADERLILNPSSEGQVLRGVFPVCVKVWSEQAIVAGVIHFGGRRVALMRILDSNSSATDSSMPGSSLWTADVDPAGLPDGEYPLQAILTDEQGREAKDEIRAVLNHAGSYRPRERAGRDQDNALATWMEHGLLGTQLGPNKNGRKW